MATLGMALQLIGLIVAPIGMLHFFSAREVVSEGTLMTWELGCLFAGAVCFLLGRRLARPGE